VVYLTTESALALGGLYLSLPEFCGLCVLILVIFKKLFSPVFKWSLLILNTLVVVMAGGRGPIIITAFILMLYIIVRFFSKYMGSRARKHCPDVESTGFKNILLAFSIAGTGMVLLGIYIENMQILIYRSFTRMMGLLDFLRTGMEDASSMVRMEHIGFSANLIFENMKGFLVGYGLGSYGILYGGIDERSYPHNIILEIWVETGLIGVLLFSIFLVYACRKKFSVNPYVWLMLYLLLNAMKSSSMDELRLFFGIVALLGLYSQKLSASNLKIQRSVP